jgi:hypothetical protein
VLATPWARRALPALLIAATLAEGAWYAHRYVTTAARDFVDPPSIHRAFFAADDSLFRVAPIRRSTFNYGWASSAGLELVTGFEPYNYVHYQAYANLMRRQPAGTTAPVWTDLQRLPRADLLDVLGGKYVLLPTEIDPPPGYRLAAHFADAPRFVFYDGMRRGDLFAYRNEDAFERAYWAAEVVPVADLAEAVRFVARRDLRDVTVVEGPGIAAAKPEAEAAPLRVAKLGPGHLRIEAASPAGGFGVISEVWHPGWRAWIDGEPVPVHRTNVAFLGVTFPPGAHTLELVFRPLYWEASLAASAVSGTALLLWALWALRRGAGSSTSDRRRPASSPRA